MKYSTIIKECTVNQYKSIIVLRIINISSSDFRTIPATIKNFLSVYIGKLPPLPQKERYFWFGGTRVGKETGRGENEHTVNIIITTAYFMVRHTHHKNASIGLDIKFIDIFSVYKSPFKLSSYKTKTIRIFDISIKYGSDSFYLILPLILNTVDTKIRVYEQKKFLNKNYLQQNDTLKQRILIMIAVKVFGSL